VLERWLVKSGKYGRREVEVEKIKLKRMKLN
jgi:hypothetical protein